MPKAVRNVKKAGMVPRNTSGDPGDIVRHMLLLKARKPDNSELLARIVSNLSPTSPPHYTEGGIGWVS